MNNTTAQQISHVVENAIEFATVQLIKGIIVEWFDCLHQISARQQNAVDFDFCYIFQDGSVFRLVWCTEHEFDFYFSAT